MAMMIIKDRTISSVVIVRARHAMITMALVASILGNASASPNTLTVQDPRPVAKAILELEKRYGWRITYEDPPYSRYRLVPRGGNLTFTLPSANPNELGAVEALVKSYNASRGGTVFAVVRGAGLLHVGPRQMTGLSGTFEPVKPILDTVITIEPKERTANALIEEICKKIFISTNTHGARDLPQ